MWFSLYYFKNKMVFLEFSFSCLISKAHFLYLIQIRTHYFILCISWLMYTISNKHYNISTKECTTITENWIEWISKQIYFFAFCISLCIILLLYYGFIQNGRIQCTVNYLSTRDSYIGTWHKLLLRKIIFVN